MNLHCAQSCSYNLFSALFCRRLAQACQVSPGRCIAHSKMDSHTFTPGMTREVSEIKLLTFSGVLLRSVADTLVLVLCCH